MSKHSLKALCLGLCALLGSASAAARTISVKEARDIAGSFFNAETHPHLAGAQKFTPVQTATEADGDYLIDQSGETLRLIDPNLTPATAPFGVYARSRQGLEAPEEIAIDESSQTGITDVEAITAAGLRLSRTGTLLNIDVPAATHLNIYDLRGRAVITLTIPAGRTTYALPAGLYIINGKKIIM